METVEHAPGFVVPQERVPLPLHPVAAEDKVLAVVARLAPDISRLDLDRIDGEFFWRCVHAPFFSRLEDLARRYADLRAALAVGTRAGYPPAEWRESDQVATAVERCEWAYRKASELSPFPGFVSPMLARRPTLRPAEVAVVGSRRTSRLQVLVHSAAWTGAEVESAIEEWEWAKLQEATERDPGAVPPLRAPDGIHVTNVQFALVAGPRFVHPLFGGAPLRPSRPPCVAVFAPLPLSHPGGIGREYDAVVRGQHGWHLRLPGATASRQEGQVALRTWGVALLATDGARFGDAMRRVCAAAEMPEVSQTRYIADRGRLLDRVPEARPSLLQRFGAG